MQAVAHLHPPCDTPRSAGKQQEFEGETYTIEELTENRCGGRGCCHAFEGSSGAIATAQEQGLRRRSAAAGARLTGAHGGGGGGLPAVGGAAARIARSSARPSGAPPAVGAGGASRILRAAAKARGRPSAPHTNSSGPRLPPSTPSRWPAPRPTSGPAQTPAPPPCPPPPFTLFSKKLWRCGHCPVLRGRLHIKEARPSGRQGRRRGAGPPAPARARAWASASSAWLCGPAASNAHNAPSTRPSSENHPPQNKPKINRPRWWTTAARSG
jgi:hypothetical protein